MGTQLLWGGGEGDDSYDGCPFVEEEEDAIIVIFFRSFVRSFVPKLLNKERPTNPPSRGNARRQSTHHGKYEFGIALSGIDIDVGRIAEGVGRE